MPHFIIEYTDNIKDEIQIDGLLRKVNDVLISYPSIFPIGGIRSRAIELKHYRVADGTEDDAFVHAILKIELDVKTVIKPKYVTNFSKRWNPIWLPSFQKDILPSPWNLRNSVILEHIRRIISMIDIINEQDFIFKGLPHHREGL